MKDFNYRNQEQPPVPLHAIDTTLVQSLHRELRVVHKVLLDICETASVRLMPMAPASDQHVVMLNMIFHAAERIKQQIEKEITQ